MSTVGVNGRTVVHKGSAGFSVAANDVCFTPAGLVGMDAVPYVNLGLSSDAINEAFTVYSEGQRVMNATSIFGMTSGDEPGTIGGVISRTFMGKASFANFSQEVSIEGAPTPRAFDPMMQNHGSPYNAYGPVLIQAVVALAAYEIVCKAICFCHRLKRKMDCFKKTLALQRMGLGPMGGGPVWDPLYPNVWLEVPYTPGGTLITAYDHSLRHTDENGRPLPLPAPEYPPPPGSSRPDVVITVDPHKPPARGNIAKVYEVKFPGDRERKGQKKRYQDATRAEVDIVSPEECGCGDKKKRKRSKAKAKQPQAEPKRVPEPSPFQRLGELPVEQQILIGIGLGIAAGLLGPALIPIKI